jgi:hypothetical protein
MAYGHGVQFFVHIAVSRYIRETEGLWESYLRVLVGRDEVRGDGR